MDMGYPKIILQPISTRPQHSLSERRPPGAEKEEDGAPAPGVGRGQPHPLPQGSQGSQAAGQHARARPEEQPDPDADAGCAGPAAAPCQAWLSDGYSQILRSYVFGPSGSWTMAPLRYATQQNLIHSFPWIAPHARARALHPGAILGKEGIKFCSVA